MSTDKSLTSMLAGLEKNGKYPMHMPGHKRNKALLHESFLPYGQDVTEIAGFDDLHDMKGVIGGIAQRAAELYGVRYAFPLVNGSSGGILAAVRALTRRGDHVILARNCHRSVYHAIELCGLVPEYIYPETDRRTGIALSITPDEVERAFERCPDATALILTSPTYEGVISDIESISKIAHKHSTRVILDAAHGAHCGLYCTDFFPECGIKYADIAITSLHKTMPSLTQTALALVNSDTARERLARQLSVFESSSPSYILLSSIERCIDITLAEGELLFDAWRLRFDGFEKKCQTVRELSFFRPTNAFALDRSKISVISSSGSALAEHMRACGIEPEMSSASYLLLMTSMFDTDKGFELTLDALKKTDKALLKTDDNGETLNVPRLRRAIEIFEATELEGKKLPLADAEGKLSLDYIMAYPPGIPLVVPGEILSREMIDCVTRLRADGVNVNGEIVSVANDSLVLI